MNDELHKRLAARLTPEFAPHPRVHISIPAGWEPVVTSLATSLDRHWPDWQLHQVKQKLGHLEVYLADPPPEVAGAIWALVDAARREAAHRCERCGTTDGAPRVASVGGWRMTLCDTCRDSATRAWLAQVGLTDDDLTAARATRPDRLAALNAIVTVLDVVLEPEELTAWLRRPHFQLRVVTPLEAVASGRGSDVHAAAVELVERSDL